jgi:L-iditol 2-dehydrogenase
VVVEGDGGGDGVGVLVDASGEGVHVRQGLAEIYLADTTATHAITADHLTDAQTTLIQPLATVLYATEKLGADLDGVRATVLGLGPIGLPASHVLAHRGAEVTGVDPIDRDPAIVTTFGITHHIRDTAAAWSRRDPDPPSFAWTP